MAADSEIIDAMQRFGGSFVKELASLWHRADHQNKARLKAAFPEYWSHYSHLIDALRPKETSTDAT